MATLRNKQKLAAVTRETQEEHPRNGQSRNTSVLRINEDYIIQVFEQIEGRVTKKLSQEYSRTESRILGALSKLDEFLLNQQIRTHSGTGPETFRNTNVDNQGTNDDDSQSDPHPEAAISRSQITQKFGPEVGHDMVTGLEEEIPYCFSGISSGEPKKARCTSQPQFPNENTPTTTEASQILLAFQQLANNGNSTNINFNRISKLPKSLTTTMPSFAGKSEKFELLEDLFQTSLKIHNQITEEDKINYFHFLMRDDALQTFKSFSSLNGENLTEILTEFGRKYVNPQSLAAAKHKF